MVLFTKSNMIRFSGGIKCLKLLDSSKILIGCGLGELSLVQQAPQVFSFKKVIRCTFWFNAGSRINENKLETCFVLFLALVGSSNPAEPYHNPFSNPAGQRFPLLPLTYPKINVNFTFREGFYLFLKK